MKKVIFRTLLVVVLVVLGYTALWYVGAYRPYYELQEDFPEIEDYGVRVYVDEDGFNYSVSVPDFPSWEGNLAVTQSDVRYALIVWMKPFKSGYSQGVLLNGFRDLYTQIMLVDIDTAEDSEDQPIVDETGDIIALLFEKANNVWGLGLT